ncbi:MAG: hypothetical protein IAF58_15405 [Leptolyngbya sp.]|nr:hypothetical protein [Candidatus Melainabacteria bacterium]
MRENRRTKDWLTPEILERATEQQRLVSRPAAETSDHIGKPLEEMGALVAFCVPGRDDLISLKELLEPRFLKLFALGIILSGALSFFTMNFGNIMSPHSASWSTLTSTARNYISVGNLDGAEHALNASLNCSYIDSAQKSYTYALLARVADGRRNFSDGQNFQALSAQHKASQWGLLVILLSIIFLGFTTGLLNPANENAKVKSLNSIFIGTCAFGISVGMHLMYADIPIIFLVLASAVITLLFFVSNAFGSHRLTAFFATPSRK